MRRILLRWHGWLDSHHWLLRNARLLRNVDVLILDHFQKLNGLAVSHVFHAGVQLVHQLLGLLLVEALGWVGHVDQCGLPRRILSLNRPSMVMGLALFYL